MTEGNFLTEIFMDTQKMLWEDRTLILSTRRAVASTKVLPENLDTTTLMGSSPAALSVTDEPPLEAARRLAGRNMKVAVLNMANTLSPGGDCAYGKEGREEDLCRRTNLYACLTKPEIYSDFYQYNAMKGSMYSDRIIYSEDVTVFKDSRFGTMDPQEWFNIDVLTCAPPNIGMMEMPDVRLLKKLFYSRIKNILTAAHSQGVQGLILGDFGCAGQRYLPAIVGDVFRSLLVDGEFRSSFIEIVFAIQKSDSFNSHCFKVFTSVLCPWQDNPVYGRRVSVLSDNEDLWWPKILNYLGGTIMANNSIESATVCGRQGECGNSDWRVSQLLYDGKAPDAIIVWMGIWDFYLNYPVFPRENSYFEDDYDSYFALSYEVMIYKIRTMFPKTDIFCSTLIAPATLSGRLRQNGRNDAGISIQTYNKAIARCAAKYGCRLIELNRYVDHYSTMDGVHGDEQGIRNLTSGWLAAIENCGREEELVVESRGQRSFDISILLIIAAIFCVASCAASLITFVVLMGKSVQNPVTYALFAAVLPIIFTVLGFICLLCYGIVQKG